MVTLLVFMKNFCKGMLFGAPLWICGIISELIAMLHTHTFAYGSILIAALWCGLIVGEIVCNIVSLITGELVSAIKHDIKAAKRRRAKKAAKAAAKIAA
mgnify:FL=1